MVLTRSKTEKGNNVSNISVQKRRLKRAKNKKDEEENIAGKLKRHQMEDKQDIETSLVINQVHHKMYITFFIHQKFAFLSW
jgi:shikimate 5-dehydrogenase